METVEGLLATIRVSDPDLRVERLGPGPVPLDLGARWSLVAVAGGRLDVLDTGLGPGDAVLSRRRGSVAARSVGQDATVLVARFALHGAEHRLVPLPDPVVVPAESELCHLLVSRLAEQVDDGSGAVADRLLDWLVADTVRDVLAGQAPVSDPGVAAALAAIHTRPAEPWTVARLAGQAGVGRAAFARRFHDAVGTSPLSYLREHRLDLAERALLAEPDATIAAVARRVGYASPFSFSTAFRRRRGVTPSEMRSRPAPAASKFTRLS